MYVSGRCFAILGAVLALSFPSPLAAAGLPQRLTVEWIHGDDADEVTATPSYKFVGNLLLRYDETLPENERTVELIDPGSGRVQVTVDAEKALASLAALVPEPDAQEEGDEEDEPEELGSPSDVSRDGKYGLYRRDGDLFLLDLGKSTFRRLTNVAGDEESARFSPDGSHVGFVRDHDLYAVDVADGEETRLTSDGDETTLNGVLSWVYWEELFNRDDDRGFSFSPDSKKIAYLQFDDSPVDVMTYVDPGPDPTRVVRQRYPKAGTTNPRVRAGVVDLASGETTWIDLGRYPYEYLVRLVWLPDGERLIAQTLDRPQRNLDLFLVNASTGAAKHLFREADEAWVDVRDDLVFLAGGKRFVWASDRAGHTHLYLYELDDDGARLVRPLTSGEWSLSDGGARRADGLSGSIAAVDEKGGWVWFMAKKQSHLENHLYRVRLDGTELTRVTQQQGSHRTSWSADGRFFLDAHSSLLRPPATDLRRAAGELVRTLVEPSSELADHFGFSRPELLTIAARDGFGLPALLFKPRGFDAGRKYPVVVNVYGGPAAPRVADRWYGSLFDHLLNQEGFVVFFVDPRTSTTMGKPTTRLLLRDFYGRRETDDILDGVRWLKKQPYVDANRVGITGWSGGGTTTVSAMTKSEEFRAGIAGAGVYDFRLYDTVYTERYMKHPDDNPEGYERTTWTADADKLHGRLMLIHGSYDDNVHPQNVWRLVDALIDAEVVFDLAIYPMRKHGFRDDEALLHRDKVRLDFWKRELGTGE